MKSSAEAMATPSASSDLPSRAAYPERFGPFILTARLGVGGVSEVLRAKRADDSTQRTFALKRLVRPEQDAIQRLYEEARLGQSIHDSRIVEVVEQGSVNNRPYLVMELVDGIDLYTLIVRLKRRHQAFPTEVIIAIMMEIAQGLRALHEHRKEGTGELDPIIHCDLKPSNLIIRKDGLVKISDLGISRQASTIAAGIVQSLSGTLGYMAPERLAPAAQVSVDPRIDLFSLGVIGYELCTMESLFYGAPQRMMQQLLNAKAFVNLSLEKIPDYIHPNLKKLIARLLEASPEQRIQSADIAFTELKQLHERLKLTVDLGHFISPYVGFDPLEEAEERITAHLPRRPNADQVQTKSVRAQITHLNVNQLTEMCRSPQVTIARPEMVGKQREARQRRLIITITLISLAFLLTSLTVYAIVPTRIEISSNPLNAFVQIQPECEGKFGVLNPTPIKYHSSGPWPLCFKFTAPGYVTEVTKLYRPSVMQKVTQLDFKMQKEVCVEVDSKPVGLPVFVDYGYRGTTSASSTVICGLIPDMPYVVQLEYRNERWDIEEIRGKAGETISVFHDFGGGVTAKSTPMQRCERYFKGKQYQRAVEICRVAVTEAEGYEERVQALIIQARAYVAMEDPITGCNTLHSALGTSVEYRDLELERRVQDWRALFNCGPLVQLKGAAEGEQPASPDAAASGAAQGTGAASPEGAAKAEGAPAGAAAPAKPAAASSAADGAGSSSQEVAK